MNIILSGILQKFTQYQREHRVEALTVQEGIDGLIKSYPGLNQVLLDPSGQLRRAHTFFLNGSQLTSDQLAEQVGEQDKLEILTAIAGG